MGTNTILRNVLLLEGKDYTPEQIDDILTIVPPALREAYGSDYECAKQFVAEYASQIIL